MFSQIKLLSITSVILLVGSSASFATGKGSAYGIIPAGAKILVSSVADLDNDDMPDIVSVYEYTAKWTETVARNDTPNNFSGRFTRQVDRYELRRAINVYNSSSDTNTTFAISSKAKPISINAVVIDGEINFLLTTEEGSTLIQP